MSDPYGKAFTAEEANALIPELERIIRRIRRRHAKLEATHDKIQVLDALWGEAVEDPANPDHDELVEHREVLGRVADEIEGILRDEIARRGIRIPQGVLEHGLLDFPTTLDGRRVYLCWRLGEPRIETWHEVDAGFAGRQPLTPEVAARIGRSGPG